MPFITQDRRKAIANGKIKIDDFEPGDRCYLHYKFLVTEWRANPRWATADRLYQQTLQHNFTVEDMAATQLAWQIFFQIYVLPYELKQRSTNGDI